MKNFNKILILMMLVFIISTPFVVFSQVANLDSTVSKEYISLSPLPGTEKVDLDDTSTYFSNLFTIFIVIASTLAVIRLILCGITYMTSESVSTKTDSKGCIWAVLGGLFIILLSVIILGQINKDFLKVDFEPIREKISGVVKGGSTNVNTGTEPGTQKEEKPPTITKFDSDKNPVDWLESFTLSWDSVNTTRCWGGGFKTGGIASDGPVSGSATVLEDGAYGTWSGVGPSTNKKEFNYTLTCDSIYGEDGAQLTVVVTRDIYFFGYRKVGGKDIYKYYESSGECGVDRKKAVDGDFGAIEWVSDVCIKKN